MNNIQTAKINDFNKNILKLMTGTTISQAIPIMISPILTRIYEPSDFGIYAMFMSIVMIFASIINARYDAAIMLPRKDSDAINIFALALIISIVISLILLIFIIIFYDKLILIIGDEKIGLWLYFIPLGTFFIGLFNSLSFFNNRKKFYSDIAKANIIKSVILAVIQISIGLIKSGATGLISGFLISQVFSNLKLLRNLLLNNNLFEIINLKKMFILGIRYKSFPIYSALSVLLNTSIQNIVNIVGALLFSYSSMGFYSLAQRVLGLPSIVIGKAVGQVFLEKTISEKRKFGNSVKIFKSTLFKLLLISLLLFIPLYITINDIIIFAFGEKWQTTGDIIKILMPLFFIRFLTSSLSTILIAYEKQKNELFLNILLLSTTLIVLLINQFNFEKFLFYFSISMSLNYLLLLIYFYQLSKGKK